MCEYLKYVRKIAFILNNVRNMYHFCLICKGKEEVNETIFAWQGSDKGIAA